VKSCTTCVFHPVFCIYRSAKWLRITRCKLTAERQANNIDMMGIHDRSIACSLRLAAAAIRLRLRLLQTTVFFSLWIAAAAIQTAATVSACSQPNTPLVAKE
jgi:hypothetical protein